MYKLIEWSEDLDLSDFYVEANKRGFYNNSSQKTMVDCFRNEREWKVWILYHNNIACGSVGAHSLDILGHKSYRILARTCAFAEHRPNIGLMSIRKMIKQHQAVVSQLYIPKCIEWIGVDKDMYITSNKSVVGSQRMVHNIYCPELEKIGVFVKHTELEYRGHLQTFWKLDADKFLDDIKKYPRWSVEQ
jgi:hypothetical protein